MTVPASPVMFAGNADTLKHEPKLNNIDTYTRLREFWQRHYSAHYMTLVVQSKGNISSPKSSLTAAFGAFGASPAVVQGSLVVCPVLQRVFICRF